MVAAGIRSGVTPNQGPARGTASMPARAPAAQNPRSSSVVNLTSFWKSSRALFSRHNTPYLTTDWAVFKVIKSRTATA